MRQFTSLALVLALASACRDSSGDKTPKPDAQDLDDVSIYDIQNDAMPECDPANPATCSPFSVRGVVVTAIDAFGAETGRTLWVQEPEGGPFSGVKVFGAQVDQLAGLSPGDIVDIEGAVKEEFACEPCMKPDMSGRSLTEIKNAPGGQLTIRKKSSGAPLEPAQVDALAIGQMEQAARDAEWEKWEGVLIRVTNVTQTAKQFAPTNPDPDDYEFRITGGIRVRSDLTALPMNNAAGDCYASITGIGDYFFDWLLLPRAPEDFGGAGASCPAAETACTDGIDNDGNGFKDCADFSCQSTEPSCASVATIAQLQMGEVTGTVELQNVVVAGISFNKKNIWVQSDAQAAEYQGIYVRSDMDLSSFAVGTRVNIVGKVAEGQSGGGTETLTQIQLSTITAGTGDATPLPVANQSAAVLSVAATGEPLEGVLIELKNVKVMSLGVAQDFIATLQQNGTTFKADDDIYRLVSDDLNDCFSSIIGFWHYNVFVDDWVFVPRKGSGAGPDGTLAANASDCN